MNEAVGRVQVERQLRGSWSIRRAADESGTISNQTWSVFETNGIVTAKVRVAVAKAFDWPMDWPENLPPVVNSPDDLDELRRRVAELERDVGFLLKRQKKAVQRAARPPRRRASDTQ